MNVTLKEFKKLVESEGGTAYILIKEDHIYLKFEQQGISTVSFYLATAKNETKTFKSIKSLHKFLSQHLYETCFKFMTI